MSHPASKLENNWFTIDEIDEATFGIGEYGQWMKVHSYLFVGEERAALIDTGLGVGNIRTVVEELTDRPVEVITTHAHWDHTGGHHHFETFSAHKLEQDWIEGGFEDHADDIADYLVKEPFSQAPPEDFDLKTFRPIPTKVPHFHENGDTLNLGGRKLEILHTPGHSPGHVCLYEKKAGYLVTADLLYQGILLAGLQFSNPEDYRQSLRRLRDLPAINTILPGHGRMGISVDLLDEAVFAFDSLAQKDLLHPGSGLHTFKRLKVQL